MAKQITSGDFAVEIDWIYPISPVGALPSHTDHYMNINQKQENPENSMRRQQVDTYNEEPQYCSYKSHMHTSA